MGRVIDPGSIYCGIMSDDAEHTYILCIKQQDERNMLIERIGEITPDNIVDAMLESETKWRAVRRFVEYVRRRKKVDAIRRNDTLKDEPISCNWLHIE